MQRSKPGGLKLMRKYPSISDNPGLEAWVEDGEWSRKEVFRKINNYNFPPPNTAARYHSTAPTGGATLPLTHPSAYHPRHASSAACMPMCVCVRLCARVCACVRVRLSVTCTCDVLWQMHAACGNLWASDISPIRQ